MEHRTAELLQPQVPLNTTIILLVYNRHSISINSFRIFNVYALYDQLMLSSK